MTFITLSKLLSAFGWSLLPSLGLSALGQVPSGNRGYGVGGGGWWAHPLALASLGKMALGASVGFLALGGP